MARIRTERIHGPYEHGRRWRVVTVGADGKRRRYTFESSAAAEKFIDLTRAELAKAADVLTISTALEEYAEHMRAKGNKPLSIEQTGFRLRAFFRDVLEVGFTDLNPRRGQRLYDELRVRVKKNGQKVSVDYHRNALAEAKTFMRWAVGRGWLRTDILEQVQGVGKRHKGKAQLRIDEARKWTAKALELTRAEETLRAGANPAERREARQAAEGSVAAMMSLWLNLRCSEIVGCQVRDVDDGGSLLWVADSKTPSGRRICDVPEFLRPLLLKLTKRRDPEGHNPTASLFSSLGRGWPRRWVKRICVAAGVPTVTAHGMRGAYGTLRKAFGAPVEEIAKEMGHSNPKVTVEHYIDRETSERADQRRVFAVLEGGRR